MQQPEFDRLPETFVRYGLPLSLSTPSESPMTTGISNSTGHPGDRSDNHLGNHLGDRLDDLDQSDLSPNVSSDTFIELLVEAWRGEEDSKQEANQQAVLQLEQELQEVYDQLIAAKQKIHLQETAMESLETHINQIEQELESKSTLLAQADLEKEDLRDRLRRQHHHTSQLKAALEKRVETVSKVIPLERPRAEKSENPSQDYNYDLTDPDSIENITELKPFQKSSELAEVIDLKPELKKLEPKQPELKQPEIPKIKMELNEDFGLPQLISPLDAQSTVIEFIQTVPTHNLTVQDLQDLGASENTLEMDSLELSLRDGRSLHSLAEVRTANFPKLSQLPPTPAVPAALPQSAVISGKRKTLTSLGAVQLPKFPPLNRN